MAVTLCVSLHVKSGAPTEAGESECSSRRARHPEIGLPEEVVRGAHGKPVYAPVGEQAALAEVVRVIVGEAAQGPKMAPRMVAAVVGNA